MLLIRDYRRSSLQASSQLTPKTRVRNMRAFRFRPRASSRARMGEVVGVRRVPGYRVTRTGFGPLSSIPKIRTRCTLGPVVRSLTAVPIHAAVLVTAYLEALMRVQPGPM